MKTLTGSLEEFSLNVCEDLSLGIQQAACAGYKIGFGTATQVILHAFAECTETGEFDINKFSRLMRPFLEDLATHAKP